MNDPLGLIGQTTPIGRAHPARTSGALTQAVEGPSFRDVLQQEIDQVNSLQKDAKEAVEDLAAGRREDMESVIIATRKAETAFNMLLQVRNKVMDAYEEVKQIRI